MLKSSKTEAKTPQTPTSMQTFNNRRRFDHVSTTQFTANAFVDMLHWNGTLHFE